MNLVSPLVLLFFALVGLLVIPGPLRRFRKSTAGRSQKPASALSWPNAPKWLKWLWLAAGGVVEAVQVFSVEPTYIQWGLTHVGSQIWAGVAWCAFVLNLGVLLVRLLFRKNQSAPEHLWFTWGMVVLYAIPACYLWYLFFLQYGSALLSW